MSKIRDRDYTNSEFIYLLIEHIHNEKHRMILKYRFVDGYTFEQIAEKVDLSTQRVKTIVYKAEQKLIKYL